ncbi:hypothetical protein M422DRAFT_78959, partial [Sphaerobolus stellatus SS14]
DGSDWSVLPDWEARKGIVNDIMTVMSAEVPNELQERFADDTWFKEVIEHLAGSDKDKDPRIRRRAKHRAANFMIDEGKLWLIKLKGTDRVTRVECIPTREGFQTALKTHEDNGHFGWEHTKLKLNERFFWP